ncbi:MAG: ExbD/TolR family protein [Planctomycetaceae bacterium]
MKFRRSTKLLVDVPAVASGDIAFNLIVFFLVCASTQPDTGRSQILPKSEQTQQQQEQQDEHLTVDLKRTAVLINGDPVKTTEIKARVKAKLAGKSRPEDRVVIVKSADDVPYHAWIEVTSQIEDAGGIITLQLEEERTVDVPQ